MWIKKSLYVLAMVAAGIVFPACKGEVGPLGPKGDTGKAGEQGPAGAKGDKGDTGDVGEKGASNSNIMVLNVDGGEITAGTNGAGYSWVWGSSDLPVEVVEASAVHVYLQVPSGAWYVLPGAVLSESTSAFHTFALRITIEENRTRSRFRITRTEGAGALSFKAGRVILVPQTETARQAAVDYADYEAVKKYYNLAD